MPLNGVPKIWGPTYRILDEDGLLFFFFFLLFPPLGFCRDPLGLGSI